MEKTGDDRYDLPAKAFYKLLRNKLLKVFRITWIFRFFLKLLFKKLNVLAALKEPISVLRFSFAFSAFTLIFNLIRRFFALQRKSFKAK